MQEFDLKPGQEIVVPSGVRLWPAKNQAKHPETPLTVRLLQRGKKYSFFDGDVRRGKNFVLVLFVPRIAPGDTIIINWVDQTCACAKLKPAA